MRAEQVRAAPGSGAMFDAIARRYDLLNRLSSLGLDRGWRRAAADALLLVPGAKVLDLATGTADLAIEIARREPSAHVTGLDASPRMLELAARKIAARGLEGHITLQQGDAEHLPFADASFDRATVAFGIRNMPDRERVLRELARVVRPGGLVVVLELSMPQRGPLAAPARFHIREVVPRLGAWLSGEAEYRHLERSIAAFPPPVAFSEELTRAGLVAERVDPLTFGVVVLFVARRPDAPGSTP